MLFARCSANISIVHGAGTVALMLVICVMITRLAISAIWCMKSSTSPPIRTSSSVVSRAATSTQGPVSTLAVAPRHIQWPASAFAST